MKPALPAPCRPQRRQAGVAWWRALLALGALAALLMVGAAGWLRWWSGQALALSEPEVTVSVAQGQTPRSVAQSWVAAGVQAPSWLLYEWFRWSGQARQIRAGNYEASGAIKPVTPASLLDMMVQGDEALARVKLIEGWTFKRWREELGKAEGLQPTTQGQSESDIMQALGLPGLPAEGQFFPDTYAYTKGAADLTVMRRAHRAMQQQLQAAWAQRQPDLPLASPQQALILASIIEKETGHHADRPDIAAVFINRLRLNMPLQTDPTVIYGLGDAFNGNLRKVHLQTDTPYNTYTRGGLPPTPIAMPGRAALVASVQPSQSRALYFVAKGDGRSAFSETLDEHNRAVNRYQRAPQARRAQPIANSSGDLRSDSPQP